MRRDRDLDAQWAAAPPVRATRAAHHSAVLTLIVLGLGAGGAATARAQTAYKAANAASTIIPRSSGFLQADFAETQLTLHYLREFLRSGLGVAPYAGVAARKGQADMFSGFDFNPGVEAGLLVFASLGSGGRALDAVAVSTAYRRTERKIVTYNDDSTTVTLRETTQADATAALNLNLALGAGTIVGVGGLVRREWSSPGGAKPVEICVPARGPGGIIVPLCSDRYTVPLADHWAGQVRADLLWNARRLSSARSQPHLAALGSASVDLGQDVDPRLNVGVGIGVTPTQYPGHLIVAVFFELYDVLDAGGIQPSFADQFVTRVVLGVPFDLLVN